MKATLLHIKDQIFGHPWMISFFALLSTLLKFALQSAQVDGVLFIFLFFMIGIDTLTGVRMAKIQKMYDYKVMKDKFLKKVLGYIIFLIALWVFTMMLFLMNIKDGETIANSYYLNVPMMTTFLFFAGVEFLSIKDNVQIIFGIKTPNSVVDNIEKFVGGKQDINDLIKGDDK